MTSAAIVALDLLREARSRRWTLALFGVVTLALLLIAAGLRLDVVDGALAATRLFGSDVRSDVRSVDVALRPLFVGASYVVFYGGLVLGIPATSDFAVALLAPGRIEHLLALPVRRWELLAGTFLGVLALVLAGAAYGGLGVVLVLWAKTGVLNAGPVWAALAAAVAFAPVYAAMLLTAVVARSAAVSAGAGLAMFLLGVVASHRSALAELLEAGAARATFLGVTAAIPRLTRLAAPGAHVAGAEGFAAAPVLALGAGTLTFALALLALAIARFDRKDY